MLLHNIKAFFNTVLHEVKSLWLTNVLETNIVDHGMVYMVDEWDVKLYEYSERTEGGYLKWL